MAAQPWARFDDLRAGMALLCPPPRRVLTAVRPDEVAGVLQEVHDATERGSWAFGYVAYEAAAGLDAQLPGRPAAPGEPPLVWFGLCDEPAAGRPGGRPPTPVPDRPPGGRTGPTTSTRGRSRRSARTSPPVTPTSAT